jgi:hypothetical protein
MLDGIHNWNEMPVAHALAREGHPSSSVLIRSTCLGSFLFDWCSAITIFPKWSKTKCWPGNTTVAELGSSMTAGPMPANPAGISVR